MKISLEVNDRLNTRTSLIEPEKDSAGARLEFMPFQPRRRVEVEENNEEMEYDADRDETPNPST